MVETLKIKDALVHQRPQLKSTFEEEGLRTVCALPR